MKISSRIFLCTLVIIPISILPLSGAEHLPDKEQISAEELLIFSEDRIGLHSKRLELNAALTEMERRIQSEQSPYLAANRERVDKLRLTNELYTLRWRFEDELYSFQRDPQAMVNAVKWGQKSPVVYTGRENAAALQHMAQDNILTALHLLALYAAYDISIGDFDQAIETMLLYRDLPGFNSEDAHDELNDQQSRIYLEKFLQLLQSLEHQVERYNFRRQRLPVPEAFGAAIGFSLAGAALVDLLIPAVSIPFFPGSSSARSAALAGTALSGGIIGISAISIPPLIRTPPIQPLTDYLAQEWGHLIEGSIQVFEDYRHRSGQLIVLSLMQNRLVVFPEASEPKELPAVFNVQRPGNFRIQVSMGHDRISTPVRELHSGLNLILLYE